MQLVRDCSCFPHIFWSSYEYLVHSQNEDSRAHEMVI